MTQLRESKVRQSRWRIHRADALIVALLLVGTIALYARVTQFDFINYDDGGYVYDNRHVSGGLSLDNVVWAFTTGKQSNWHPLIWLSFMLDVSLFGVKPGPMHLENVLLHAANAALLFALLKHMTNLRWASAWAAAIFAWHPLHVESVAWITERKDVLSTLFMMLCLLAYVRYARAPSGRAMVLVAVLLLLGLLAKPMLVTLPFVMLLLDAWPLRRMRTVGDLPKLLIEKLGLFALVVLSSVATYLVQSRGHSVVSGEQISLASRLANAIESYALYLLKTFDPRGLAVFYPIRPHHSPVMVAIAGIVLLAISVIAIVLRKSHPWLLVGWLWYLGTLVPVIGLVQVGAQSHADRYTYVPLIGILFAIAFEGRYWACRHKALRVPLKLIAVAVLVAAAVVAERQIGYWRNSETLMRHAIDVVPDNYVAHSSLGEALESRGDGSGAIHEYLRALAIHPSDAVASNNLALIAMKRGDTDEALRRYQDAIHADPDYVQAYNNYGNLLADKGRVDEAIAVYREGIARKPDFPQIYNNLATALAAQGKVAEAIPLWRQAIALDPGYVEAHANLGPALIMTGDTRQGLQQLRLALDAQPDRVDTLKALAWTLATHPSDLFANANEAQKLAQRAVDLTHGQDAIALDTLGAAEARAGRFDKAIADAQRAVEAAEASKNAALADEIRKRIELYRAGHCFISAGSS